LLRVGGSDYVAEISYRVVFFQDGRVDGAAGHEANQFSVEGTLFVNGVESTGLLGGQTGVFQSDYRKTSLNDVVQNFAGVAIGYGVGLNHGKSAIAHGFQIKFGAKVTILSQITLS